MADKEPEDLASVLEEALAEAETRAEARARDRGTPAPPGDADRPTLEEASRGSVRGLRQRNESALPPVRRTRRPETMQQLLATEGGPSWAVAWVIAREALALIGLFWITLIVVSFTAPEGAAGLGVLPFTVVLTVVLRLIILGTTVLVRRGRSVPS